MRIHLIAIGGAAMHNIAISLQINHHTVSGSDDEIYNPARDRLARFGLLPAEMGWFPDSITPDIDIIILGMHARADNPELQKARKLGLRILSYPAFVYQQAQSKRRLVVAGSHGKTTTTSMILHVLKHCRHPFDYLVGAQLDGFDHMVQFSDAPLMVIEGDEYLSSAIDRRPKFLHYRPQIAILTGIAWDHINVFPTFEEYKEQFSAFIKSLPHGALLIYYQHDPHIVEILKDLDKAIQTQAYEAFHFEVVEGQCLLFDDAGDAIPLQVFGKHNLENLKAAYLACQAVGITKEAFFQAIPSFQGAAKRLQLLHKTSSSAVYQDFAHAPSKVKATVEALRQQYPDRQLVACLELHTFSSLSSHFLNEYRHSLDAADAALVYFSEHTLRMKRLPPLSKQEIKSAFDHPALQVFTERVEVEAFIDSKRREDCNLLLMSSGTFGGLDLRALAQKA